VASNEAVSEHHRFGEQRNAKDHEHRLNHFAKSKAQWEKTKPKSRCQRHACGEREGKGHNCSNLHGNYSSITPRQFGMMLREQEKGCALCHTRNSGEIVPAHESPRAALIEYLVAIQIRANRRHKKEPQAQYATGLGLGSLLPQLRLLSWAALSVSGMGPPSTA
jgi:hypothetical protein